MTLQLFVSWTAGLLAFWILVSFVGWFLPSEDGMRSLGLILVLFLGGSIYAPFSDSPQATLLLVFAALVHLIVANLFPPLVGIPSSAALVLLTVGMWQGVTPASPLKRFRRVGRALAWLTAVLYVCLTPWPYYVWPWSTMRAEIAQRLRESAFSVPPPDQLPFPEHPGFRQITHPLFRVPIEISLNSFGPVGPDARTCWMFFGDGRIARIDIDEPRSFGDAFD